LAGAAAGGGVVAAAGTEAPAVATIEMSDEYRALVRRLSTVGSLLSALVLITILFMIIKP
ncbi:MAG TPA: hypothetical protein VN892_12360, partial [Solirubrobacteraceae bacterium]|nr:hypothetical protein [Solirubrobacteraceae bacterium]